MKTTALLLAAVLAVSAAPARAEAPTVHRRGPVTWVGFGLMAGSLAGVGLGVAGLFSAGEANTQLSLYDPAKVTADEGPAVNALQQRVADLGVLAGLGFGLGAAMLIGSIICLVVDAPVTASVAFVPTAQGGVFSFSARF